MGACTVVLDAAQADADFVLRQTVIGGEVDQPFFFLVEIFDAFGELGMHGAHAALLVGQSLREQLADAVYEIGW
ncbi:hypothetical protein [Mycobacteroides abscessus]|uniref:hypothetical protein n=1 Tax=Mycobacteroides abscessus TaxID=36809 RepID=UPI001F3FC8C4|nr:hypothetical protein [Mycobacteroides abscessus]